MARSRRKKIAFAHVLNHSENAAETPAAAATSSKVALPESALKAPWETGPGTSRFRNQRGFPQALCNAAVRLAQSNSRSLNMPRDALAPHSTSGGQSTRQEWVDHPNACNDLSVIQVFGEQFDRLTLLRSGQDHAIPERKLPDLADLRSARNGFRRDPGLNPGSIIAHDLTRHGAGQGGLDLLCHVDVKLLQHLRAEQSGASVPQPGQTIRRAPLPVTGIQIVGVDQNIGINEGSGDHGALPGWPFSIRRGGKENARAPMPLSSLARRRSPGRGCEAVRPPAWRSHWCPVARQTPALSSGGADRWRG